MDPDSVFLVEDYSPDTLAALSGLLERSTSREHCAYREAELDDLWRILDTAVTAARRDSRAHELAAQLERLRASVMQAHDLVGSDEKPADAATLLRSVIASGVH